MSEAGFTIKTMKLLRRLGLYAPNEFGLDNSKMNDPYQNPCKPMVV